MHLQSIPEWYFSFIFTILHQCSTTDDLFREVHVEEVGDTEVSDESAKKKEDEILERNTIWKTLFLHEQRPEQNRRICATYIDATFTHKTCRRIDQVWFRLCFLSPPPVRIGKLLRCPKVYFLTWIIMNILIVSHYFVWCLVANSIRKFVDGWAQRVRIRLAFMLNPGKNSRLS